MERKVLEPRPHGMMRAQYCKHFQLGKTEAQVEELDFEQGIYKKRLGNSSEK